MEKVRRLGEVFKSEDLVKVVVSYDPLPVSGHVVRKMDLAADTVVLNDGRVIQVRLLPEDYEYEALVHMLGEHGWSTKLPLNPRVLFFNLVVVAMESVLLVAAGNVCVFVLDVETGQLLRTDTLAEKEKGLRMHPGLSVPRYVRWTGNALEVVDAPTGERIERWQFMLDPEQRLEPCSTRDPCHHGFVFLQQCGNILVLDAEVTPSTLHSFAFALVGSWRVGPGLNVTLRDVPVCGFYVGGDLVARFEVDARKETCCGKTDEALGLFAFSARGELLVLDCFNRREIARFPFALNLNLKLSSSAFVGSTLYAQSHIHDEVIGIDWMTGEQTVRLQGGASSWGGILDLERAHFCSKDVLLLKSSNRVYFLD